MKKYTEIVTIERVATVGCSCYGNPTKEVCFTDSNGNYCYGKTASNASIAYALGYYCSGRKFEITYHYTAKGNLIIDYGKEVSSDVK